MFKEFKDFMIAIGFCLLGTVLVTALSAVAIYLANIIF